LANTPLAGSILQIETKHFALGHKLRTIAAFCCFLNVTVQAASQNQQKFVLSTLSSVIKEKEVTI